MKHSVIHFSILAALAAAGNTTAYADHDTAHVNGKGIVSVEFIGMDAPATLEQRASAYTDAKVKINYKNGKSKIQPLEYKQLFATTDIINGKVAGGLYDVNGDQLMDTSVEGASSQYVSDTPDANSLMKVNHVKAKKLGVKGNPLFMITHYEYVTENNAGDSEYGKLPMTMSLSTIDQNKKSGELSLVDYDNIDMAGIKGLWIPCAGSLSPWNTHLGSEEYEPDARAYEADNSKDPYIPFTMRYYNETQTMSPYNYGHVPEVKVSAKGKTSIVKHYAIGRVARELIQMMPDQRTAYMGDDGAYTGLFMYVADRAAHLGSGTLYAAKWTQTSDTGAGSADLSWIKLGHATDAEIKSLVDGGIMFSDIFETKDAATAGYTEVHTNNGREWLKLKDGMEKAAAFLESRRYAAYLGATTEFNKMEGVTLNARDKKAYVAISYLEKGMVTGYDTSDVVDDIHLTKISSGAVYQMDLAGHQRDSKGHRIHSHYVAKSMKGLVVGEDQEADAAGNVSNDDKMANPDNLKYSAALRTLFIGEDSGRHVNNYLWAYNIDTGKLSRILSLPVGAESTGLQAVDNLNGFAYVMSNFQHPGEYIHSINATLQADVDPLINSKWDNKKKAAVGYISGIPAIHHRK
jgi:secreted PhoX family phosphatase